MINTANEKCTRELSDTVKQRYRINTVGKSPTELQRELEQRGVNGFVVKVHHNKVSMLVNRADVKKNREMMR
ncbi:hypothetical protein [Staphylococcus americanisciuri]|uniref:Phage protein n=1 Tax=Staphylococcus americanisciuri TaxID=2973940 RepID=A0ABT2F5Y3_9STAP|nr:hypothetical protein [Staphylococcus americanisciuri]MCS4487212.1 hypothetical protein [Staphylococcus americanisciuri]